MLGLLQFSSQIANFRPRSLCTRARSMGSTDRWLLEEEPLAKIGLVQAFPPLLLRCETGEARRWPFFFTRAEIAACLIGGQSLSRNGSG